MGAPPIPDEAPLERVKFLALRAKPGGNGDEWYYRDTGETLQEDPDEFTPAEYAAILKAEAAENARHPGKK